MSVRGTSPRRVGVIGAGMVGLSTAWFLQEQGMEVTVLDRGAVAAGASWGNAGWITPGISTPLPEPAVLKYGIHAVVSPSSPVYVPPSLNPRLIRFLLSFVRHSTTTRWKAAMEALVAINRHALAAFDELADGGVTVRTNDAKSFLAAYRTTAEQQVLLDELRHIRAAGQTIEFDVLSGAEAREIEPSLSDRIGTAIRLHDQRFINPGEFVAGLADAVRARGASVEERVRVDSVVDEGSGVRVTTTERDDERFDALVLATGAWLSHDAHGFGVRIPIQAGRGYSFSVSIDHVPAGPIYYPAQRVACTPIGDRLRIAGMMEFKAPDAALDRRRIAAIVDAAKPLLRGADLDDRHDEWVGSRPCTPDGLPVIGATRSERVFVAGGHGMWGITLGPATGRLLAERIATGTAPAELAPFDPLR
ncbi:FAD-dependent oxidoreductase [Nocardia cyriacigeorgica]|uniref:FAD-dependent oxidoreductase n=1 Tax=Nocardia cyriacigeorgica TaxID=135487 RepID=A0A6P1D7M8_9NOCA|nr:FAD-dependent oxidoreductase [Nocardia cyriacigeorgica]NEW42207.1 FAD-dependent oxidoreductase [Nocardia cyriacigeorgica]NEW44232.1 FAD-dependent oxidoreductase [Nocardia cyriacigeorgica]NEW51271.1 FAD-dependent oxidoreductase [Nocardia cyriacigeorgica]NEW56962.1 FAD-dependent oxidoreductase [Nocardia cyriacigeorgica]